MTNKKFKLLAGPCVIESEENILFLAEALKNITSKFDIDFFFKASWDKANRTKATNYRGPGLDEGLRILAKAKEEIGVKIVTDIHEPYQAEPVAQVADIVQIPAFLCRQTDLLKAAAATGRIVNVKKAQFASPEEMNNVVSKMEYFGCKDFMLCERGNCFGYNNLVVDMTGLVRLSKLGHAGRASMFPILPRQPLQQECFRDYLWKCTTIHRWPFVTEAACCVLKTSRNCWSR